MYFWRVITDDSIPLFYNGECRDSRYGRRIMAFTSYLFKFQDAVHSPRLPATKRRKHDYKEDVEPFIHHIKSFYNATDYDCTGNTSPKIILVGRDQRQILNRNSIITALKQR